MKNQENIQVLYTYLNRTLEAYNILSRRVEELQKEVNELKGKPDNKKEGKPKSSRVMGTKYPHMSISYCINK